MDAKGKVSNGMRLIDADRAMEIVHNQGIEHPNAYLLTNYATLILMEAPTVDAVEVLRCKVCKYHNKPPCPMRLSFNWTEDDDFCSYGERKEGAD